MTETSWLLLHGTPLTPAVWDGVRPHLEPIRPVLAPQLPVPSSARGAQAEVIAAAIDGASFQTLPGASHMSAFLDPTALAQRLIAAAADDGS